MYWTDFYLKTLREFPSNEVSETKSLLAKAGMIQKSVSDSYVWLPLGLHFLRRFEQILRCEMEKFGALEVMVPPQNLARNPIDAIIRGAISHGIRSYKDLPLLVFALTGGEPRQQHIQENEVPQLHILSFFQTKEILVEHHTKVKESVEQIIESLPISKEIPIQVASIDSDSRYDIHAVVEFGDSAISLCDSCGNVSTINDAPTIPSMLQQADEKDLASRTPKEVLTPGKKSIEEVSEFLSVKPSSVIKMLLYEIDKGDEIIGVCLRGDRELNELKLIKTLNAKSLSILDEEKYTGQIPFGYCGPFKNSNQLITRLIADTSIQGLTNAVCGGNKEDYHLVCIDVLRDLDFEFYEDLSFIKEGDLCVKCQTGAVELKPSMLLSHLKGDENTYMYYLNENGKRNPVHSGYGVVNVVHLIDLFVQSNRDDNGLIFPLPIAPFQVLINCLDPRDPKTFSTARALHDTLVEKGISVMCDDRNERPGVKFKDCDLCGFPIRVDFGKKGLDQGVVTCKLRDQDKKESIPIKNIEEYILKIVQS